jgi:Fe2+ transport system protein FeoA
MATAQGEFENRFQRDTSTRKAMTLGETAVGLAATVLHVGGERPFRRRMMELGLLPGTRVEVVRVAPLGDPIELRVRGCLLSIRREEARCIGVSATARQTEAAAVVSIAPGAPVSS